MRIIPHPPSDYEAAVGHGDLRDTPQRRHVYDQLLDRRDHPTATEVFMRAKQTMPSISLATVYNSLETLVACGLVKQVHVDREPTRYCPNREEHGHIICNQCGQVFDIDLATGQTMGGNWNLPAGFTVTSYEVSLRGVCPPCNTNSRS